MYRISLLTLEIDSIVSIGVIHNTINLKKNSNLNHNYVLMHTKSFILVTHGSCNMLECLLHNHGLNFWFQFLRIFEFFFRFIVLWITPIETIESISNVNKLILYTLKG